MSKIARVQMPDGRIGRFEVPDDATPESVTEYARTMGSQVTSPAYRPTGNEISSLNDRQKVTPKPPPRGKDFSYYTDAELEQMASKIERGGLQQPVYDPIDFGVDLATGGGKIWAKAIDSLTTGGLMSGIDAAGGGPLTQIAGTLAGHSGIQATRKAIVKSKPFSSLAKAYDKAGGSPLLNDIGAITYHGTPHKFQPTKNNPIGEFDLSKVGTGEGAQAFGHGIYLAESKGVAKNYSDMLPGAKRIKDYVKIDGKEINPNGEGIKNLAAGFIISSEMKINKSIRNINKSIQSIKNGEGFSSFYTNSQKKQKITELENIKKWILSNRDKIELSPQGNIYTVDLPDKQINKMLDWDKPLSEQGKIGNNLKKVYEKVYPHLIGEDPTGGEAYRALEQELSKKFANPREKASEYLKREGIPGIKYYDSMSRTAGEGTRNYVVFDEKLLKILKRE